MYLSDPWCHAVSCPQWLCYYFDSAHLDKNKFLWSNFLTGSYAPCVLTSHFAYVCHLIFNAKFIIFWYLPHKQVLWMLLEYISFGLNIYSLYFSGITIKYIEAEVRKKTELHCKPNAVWFYFRKNFIIYLNYRLFVLMKKLNLN